MKTSALQSPAPDTFPQWVLWCVGSLLAFSLIAVGLVRITGNGPDQLSAAITAERSLRFEDRPDGGVSVIDGNTGQLLTVMRGEQGFLRGTVRALARDRRSHQIGAELPFRLIARTDGRLALYDPLTGHRVDLESFGPDNAAVFAQFLTVKPAAGSN
ncbi:MAG: photosynthetic complex assembly protein PuhC [Rhodoferax sp.]|nr:photosynthetic complex assembly protein PuhC [Rhodoferax sp.]